MAARPHVLLGVTGSVAAVKWPEMVVSLSQFCEVRVIFTAAALHFRDIARSYNPRAWAEYEALSPQPALYTDEDEWGSYHNVHEDAVLHIELRKWADLFIVAPLSADTLAKLSHGLADNLLTSVARAWSFDKPILAVPAMNTAMWDHPLTAPQLEVLTKLGFNLVAPVSKMLACGDVGTGAMAAVDDIVTAARALLLRRDALGTVAEVRVSEENRT